MPAEIQYGAPEAGLSPGTAAHPDRQWQRIHI